MSRLLKAIKDPLSAVRFIKEKSTGHYVQLANALRYSEPNRILPRGTPDFEEILHYAEKPSDISDHLPTLFIEAFRYSPRLIVELGVRNGSSTFALERVAKLCGSTLVSVDIEDCKIESTYERRYFVQEDDISFGSRFPAWCRENRIDSKVHVLFVDTSHEYEHTVQEIDTWFKHLDDSAIVIFHDTNMQEIFRHNDGRLAQGWDNDRGVIRAIEEYLDCSIDEKIFHNLIVGDWILRHYPFCSGLTILEKGFISSI